MKFPALLLVGSLTLAPHASAQEAAEAPDSTLAGLAGLIGEWAPGPGGPTGVIVHRYDWTVGGKALRVREGYPTGAVEKAELDGLAYWNPATERIEFTAVAGRGPGQGRYFEGEYRILENGAVERIYDVFYRTLADMPGEELGGSRRRYREVYRFADPDTIEATLEWWRDGRWQPFGPGAFTVVRAPVAEER
jgi:hypothetical protein